VLKPFSASGRMGTLVPRRQTPTMGHVKAQTAVWRMTIFREPVPHHGTERPALADVRALHPVGVDVEPRLGRVRDPVTAGGDLDWLGPVDSYADRAQRLEIADAILASGSDDEGEWLEIMERTVAERPGLDREVMAEAGIDTARISPRRSSTSMRRASCCSSSSTRSAPRRYAAAASAGSP